MKKKEYLQLERRRIKTAIRALETCFSEGWNIEFHDSTNPLIAYNQAIQAHQQVDAAYTLTSPSGKRYHGDHIEFYHGSIRINHGGYQFFRDEPFDSLAFQEIFIAFNILTQCNQLRNPKEVLPRIFKKMP